MCDAHSRRTFYAVVTGRNATRLRWRSADRHLWSYRGAGSQSRPASRTTGSTSIYHLDGRHGHHGHSCRRKCESQQVSKTLGEEHTKHAIIQGYGLRWRQRYTVCSLSSGRQVSCGIVGPNDSGQTQPIPSLAILDNPPGPARARSFTALLPASRIEALLD